MATIFKKIIDGEIPCYKVAENDEFLAFLDVNPLKIGHTLVIPKIEVDYIFDIEDDLIAKMMIFAKHVAKSIQSAYPCNRIGVGVIGLEVAHAHIHLVPINSMNDINFSNTKLILSKEQFIEISNKIAQNFNQ
ncbi:MAG TPA: HIT family protein [Saprospiraceae bacterium]|nr:HIT family protein [Saprospiraceae bacterium]